MLLGWGPRLVRRCRLALLRSDFPSDLIGQSALARVGCHFVDIGEQSSLDRWHPGVDVPESTLLEVPRSDARERELVMERRCSLFGGRSAAVVHVAHGSTS